MEYLNAIVSLLKDFQAIIAMIIGVGIGYRTSTKDRRQKETITESERIDKYRLSSVNERLQIHQKAYIHWHKMAVNLHNAQNRSSVTSEATEFWVGNCLYLTTKCRKEFSEVMMLFDLYPINLQAWKDTPHGDDKEKLHKELMVSFNRIM